MDYCVVGLQIHFDEILSSGNVRTGVLTEFWCNILGYTDSVSVKSNGDVFFLIQWCSSYILLILSFERKITRTDSISIIDVTYQFDFLSILLRYYKNMPSNQSILLSDIFFLLSFLAGKHQADVYEPSPLISLHSLYSKLHLNLPRRDSSTEWYTLDVRSPWLLRGCSHQTSPSSETSLLMDGTRALCGDRKQGLIRVLFLAPS